MTVPLIVTFVFTVLFVIYSIDEDPGEVERPFQAHTLEPAGTHRAGD
jgi:hypothetical protein